MFLDLRSAIAYANSEGIPLEELEPVWVEDEQTIEDVQLILPPGVRSVAELQAINAGESLPRVWTPETAHLFED